MATATNSGTEGSFLREAGNAWNDFWFTPINPRPLAGLRILAGALALLYLASYTFTITDWFAADGLLPAQSTKILAGEWRFSLLNNFQVPAELMALHIVALLLALAFAAGLFSQITGALTLVMVLSYIHRAPMIAEQFEVVLSFLLLYVVISPCGKYWSVDSWLKQRKGSTATPDPSWVANIAQRLLQVHLALLVFFIGASRLAGATWWRGEAVWSMMAQSRSAPINFTALREMVYVLNLWTFAILAMNFLFPVLVWYKRFRTPMVVYAIVCWISLIPITGLTHYYLALSATSLAFLPQSFWQRFAKTDATKTVAAS